MTTTPIQMRFADVDMLGHVNNVNQQHYFDVGKAISSRRCSILRPIGNKRD